MAKLIFLVLILGHYMVSRVNGGEQWLHTLHELDDLFVSIDEKEFRDLPQTPQAIIQKWCRPIPIYDSMDILELIDQLFPDNTLLKVIVRIGQVNTLQMSIKFCENHHLISLVAHFNRLLKQILPDLVQWDQLIRETYLAAAEPRSHITASQLFCLQKRLTIRLLKEMPPKVTKILIKFFEHMANIKSQLIDDILHYLNIDTEDDSCRIPHPVPNYWGIQSTKTALLLAWDKVLWEHLH